MENIETYAIVNSKAGYAYVNLAKCACTSIKTAIAEQLGQPFEAVHSTSRWRISARRTPNRLTRFTFTRDPRSRLVSCWADYIVNPRAPELLLNPEFRSLQGMSFDEFVHYVCEPRENPNLHYAPQWPQLHWNGNPLVDEVFRLEDVKREWPRLMKRFGLPKLKKVRRSNHLPWWEYYTDELLEIVNHRYRYDFVCGGYPKQHIKELQQC